MACSPESVFAGNGVRPALCSVTLPVSDVSALEMKFFWRCALYTYTWVHLQLYFVIFYFSYCYRKYATAKHKYIPVNPFFGDRCSDGGTEGEGTDNAGDWGADEVDGTESDSGSDRTRSDGGARGTGWDIGTGVTGDVGCAGTESDGGCGGSGGGGSVDVDGTGWTGEVGGKGVAAALAFGTRFATGQSSSLESLITVCFL